MNKRFLAVVRMKFCNLTSLFFIEILAVLNILFDYQSMDVNHATKLQKLESKVHRIYQHGPPKK